MAEADILGSDKAGTLTKNSARTERAIVFAVMDSQDWKLKKNGSSNSAAKIKTIRRSGERKIVQRDVARRRHRIDDSEAE